MSAPVDLPHRLPHRDAEADADAFADEARRLHERYTVEIVERFNVCPWARHVRTAGAIERYVLLQKHEDLDASLEVIARLEADPRDLPVAIAIYPRLALDHRRFDAFAARLRDADQKRHGGKPVFVSATFHPGYPLDRRSPSSLVPFLRRSPDPSLQLVRLSVIEEARGKSHGKFVFDFSPGAWDELRRRASTPSVAERIATDNQRTVEEQGDATFEAFYQELAEERARRDARYATLP